MEHSYQLPGVKGKRYSLNHSVANNRFLKYDTIASSQNQVKLMNTSLNSSMAMTKESQKIAMSRGSVKAEGNFLTLDVSDLNEDKVLQKVRSIIRNKIDVSKRPTTHYHEQRASAP